MDISTKLVISLFSLLFFLLVVFIFTVLKYEEPDEIMFVAISLLLAFFSFFSIYSRNKILCGVSALFIVVFISIVFDIFNECEQIERICLSTSSYFVPASLIMTLFVILGVSAGMYLRVIKKVDRKPDIVSLDN